MHTKSPFILVVGGAGFIGSHMVLALQAAGFSPVVLDNLSTGHQDAIAPSVPFIQGDLGDRALLNHLMTTYPIAAVMHFGAFIEVGESVQNPGKYYQNNVAATLNLLDAMLAHQIHHFVFSSTAAVYGEPQYTPIDENHPCVPINPYGKSKWMVETIVQDYAKSSPLRYAILRYFNAAGADPGGRLGERHQPESHLIPLVLQVAAGQRPFLSIYGRDYATPDGTCLRDYVHVADLCSAHLRALDRLLSGGDPLICNLGSGVGYSVAEVIAAVEKVTGRSIPLIEANRRAGDPAILVADASLAKQQLDWHPRYSSLSLMIEHAWSFLTAHQKKSICVE